MSESQPTTDKTLSGSPYQGQGDPDLWDHIWLSMGQEEGHQLYTSGTPQTLRQFWQRCYFEDLWAFIGDQGASGCYLELGSGRGTTSMYLLARNRDVTMVDLSPNAFCLAEACCERNGLKLPTFVVVDARHTGLPDNSFDCIYNLGLLEHFEDPHPILAESFRLLKPGGLIFMVIVPEIPFSRRLPGLLLFNPWRLIRMILGLVKRRVQKRFLNPPSESAGLGMTRTDHPRSQYERWMHELGAEKALCLPYNPYHSVYRSEKVESLISVPVYRFHHAIKRLVRKYPLLRTSSVLALCDLLVAWK